MRISILSDEISVDPVAACELAADWGLHHLEFRLWMNTRAPNGMTEGDMKRVRKIADDFGLDFPSISPGLFKLKLDDPAYADHCADYQQKSYDLAEILGAQIVVLFPPICAEGPANSRPVQWLDWPYRVIDDMEQAATNAAARGLVLALENEPICYGGNGPTLARLLAEINHPNLKANWDPGNHTSATGEDFRAGYEALKPVHIHTHVKDYRAGTSGAIVPGEGDVDWPGQLQALQADGYKGLLVLETHFQPKIAGSRNCVERLRELLAQIGEEAE